MPFVFCYFRFDRRRDDRTGKTYFDFYFPYSLPVEHISFSFFWVIQQCCQFFIHISLWTFCCGYRKAGLNLSKLRRRKARAVNLEFISQPFLPNCIIERQPSFMILFILWNLLFMLLFPAFPMYNLSLCALYIQPPS